MSEKKHKGGYPAADKGGGMGDGEDTCYIAIRHDCEKIYTIPIKPCREIVCLFV